MTDTTEVEFWLAFDNDGDFTVSSDMDDARDNVYGDHKRLVKFRVLLPAIEAPEVVVELPAEQSAEIKVAIET